MNLRLVIVSSGDGALVELLESMRDALANGGTAVWLRERSRPRDVQRELCIALRRICKERAAALIVAGDADLALEVGADAVHLGFRDLRPEAVRAHVGRRIAIGWSAHDPLDRDAIAASDYVTLSPFAAVEKEFGKLRPLGAERFAALRRGIPVPVVALGGIDAGNVAEAIRAGADGVAVRRAARDAAAVAAAIAGASREAPRDKS